MRTKRDNTNQVVDSLAHAMNKVADQARRRGAADADRGVTATPLLPTHLYYLHDASCSVSLVMHPTTQAVWAHNWRVGYNDRVADCKRIVATAQREPLPDVEVSL